MKEFIKLLSILMILALSGVACTKTGETGAAGADGEDGMDGADGTSGCIQCHVSDEDMQVKDAEWAVSGHVLGGHMQGFYASRQGCADCHSSQGMQEVVEGGEYDVVPPSKPLPANCYTCHDIHETYTSEDWNLTVGYDGIPFRVNGHTAMQGPGDACVQCHQSRVAEPVLDLDVTDDVTITDKRYGPHHGPQGNMIEGYTFSGAYELDGSVTYANSMHATSEPTSCTTCHMASGEGSGGNMALGGHSNNVGTGEWIDGDKVINHNGCVSCHTTLTDNAAATEFTETAYINNMALLEELRVALYDLGYLDDDDYVASDNITVSSDNPLVTSTQHAAAIYNYKFLVEDQSALIHNPMYGKALLQNSLEAVE